MQILWLNDALTLKAETDEERQALCVILYALQRGAPAAESPALDTGNQQSHAPSVISD